MNLTQIEAELRFRFEDLNNPQYIKVPTTLEDVTQFYRSKITELLESTKLEERSHGGARAEGYNFAVSAQEKKIKEALI